MIGLLCITLNAEAGSIIKDSGDHDTTTIVFGNAPEYLELSQSDMYIIDFPSKWYNGDSYVFKMNEDTLVLDTLQPVRIIIDAPGEVAFKLVSSKGKTVKMNVNVIKKE